MPNKELKLWIKALESGEYKQTKGALNRTKSINTSYPKGYCCLGVACDVYRKNVKDAPKWDLSKDEAKGEYAGCSLGIPKIVREWLGLANRAEGDLINLNDAESASFKEIAEYIKTNYIKKKKKNA